MPSHATPFQPPKTTTAPGVPRARVAAEAPRPPVAPAYRKPPDSPERIGNAHPDRLPQSRPRPPRVRVVHSSADATTRAAEERSFWVYVKHALMHPWHIVVLAGATVFGVANWSVLILILVFAGAEVLLLGLVLRMRAFRNYVDERLDQIERGRAAEKRTTLLLQMGEEHRRELLRLEAVVDRIRDATRPHGTAAQIAVEECLRLLASYVRLALEPQRGPRVPGVGQPAGTRGGDAVARGRALHPERTGARPRRAARRRSRRSAPSAGIDRARRSKRSAISSR